MTFINAKVVLMVFHLDDKKMHKINANMQFLYSFEAVTITCGTFFPVWCQTASNEIHIGATIFEHGRCEGERGMREALLEGSGDMLPREILKSWYSLVASESSFLYFWRVDRTVISRVFQSIF